MKRKLNKKLILSVFAAVVSPFLAAMVASCAEIEEADASGSVILAQGDTKTTEYIFDLPSNGESEVYAKRSTAPNNANLTAYRFCAQNGYEKPYQAMSVLLVPEQRDENGKIVEACATVVFYQNPVTADTSLMPRTFDLNSSNGFSKSNYTLPMGDEGTLTFSWTVCELDSVPSNSTYTDYDVKSYNLQSVRFKAPVRQQ